VFARRCFEDHVDRVVAGIDELFESFHEGQEFAASVRGSDEDLETVGTDSADSHRVVDARARSVVGWGRGHGAQPFDFTRSVADDGVEDSGGRTGDDADPDRSRRARSPGSINGEMLAPAVALSHR
jgi:hypothetical protein